MLNNFFFIIIIINLYLCRVKTIERMNIDHPISLSSRRVAASRALESKRIDALFKDPHAEHFAGEEVMEWINRIYKNTTSRAGKIVVRTKFFDDFCMDPEYSHIRQFVCLGCGMDSRCFRLQFRSDDHFYEVFKLIQFE